MKKTIFILSVILITYAGCKKPINCDQSMYEGEKVMIPITFIGFFPQEINNIQVYRIDPLTPGKVDTFTLDKLLFAYSAHSDKENITDRPQNGNTDPYYSYLHNTTLILDWQTKRDTLSNFDIRKSKGGEVSGKCHKDDPIVKLDAVTYMYKGKLIPRDSSITIFK